MVETCPDNFYDLIWWYRRNPFRTMRGCTMVEKKSTNVALSESDLLNPLWHTILIVVEKQFSQELKIDFIPFLWHKLKMKLFVSTVQHQSMRSTSNGFHQQKMWPDFLCFLFTVFIGGWSRLQTSWNNARISALAHSSQKRWVCW